MMKADELNAVDPAVFTRYLQLAGLHMGSTDVRSRPRAQQLDLPIWLQISDRSVSNVVAMDNHAFSYLLWKEFVETYPNFRTFYTPRLFSNDELLTCATYVVNDDKKMMQPHVSPNKSATQLLRGQSVWETPSSVQTPTPDILAVFAAAVQRAQQQAAVSAPAVQTEAQPGPPSRTETASTRPSEGESNASTAVLGTENVTMVAAKSAPTGRRVAAPKSESLS